MLLRETWCNDDVHIRGISAPSEEQNFPQNTKILNKKQKAKIVASLNDYRISHGVMTQSLVEYLLAVSVDMMASDSYEGAAEAIMPFAQALTLIMNHAHAAGWFESNKSWR